MRIDHCLILAAGFGTRMGAIGQKLPKVLWPVFEKSLLELQVAYARSLGIEKIYINLHYMGEEIEAFCKGKSAFEGVTFLWEKPEILDIGGAIHNLASKVNYRGKLLVLNADQFFYLSKDHLFKILEPYQKHSGVLFSYWVNSSLGYNALEIDANRLVKKIVKNKDLAPNSRVETYTGISYIDLAQLTKTPGVSPFFESVCPFDKKDIPAILLDGVDYWDFGTVKRYWETSFNILQTYRVKSTHPFLRFLVQERALKTWKIDLQQISYHAKSANVINLNADGEARDLGPSIILAGQNVTKRNVPMVWWNDLNEEVK
ncbi:nucleotidyltransferase family protein [Peredibacter starrii]|uniref:NTP transferase domain-containing protein n=1 Tax=Peredibacter starrii TaxID=28202 RepID=A0AAX4HQ41_9BACT|nr:NTP transferase domain-containing protein [Peredibacter starrii]WPU65330.1 NTP transferase domain-containing protein [Peredibacter starrii]